MSCCDKTLIGDLRHQIKIIDKDLESDGSCGATYDKSIKHTIRAKIETRKGVNTSTGIFDSTNINSLITHVFTIRYVNDIEVDDLIEYDNRYFAIKGHLDTNETKQFVEIYAIERGDISNSRNQL